MLPADGGLGEIGGSTGGFIWRLLDVDSEDKEMGWSGVTLC